MNHTPSSRGFTLLLASLIASIVILLGISIFELVQKEIALSSLGRDSQFAFYAADTGAECALYWDVRYDYFASSTPGLTPTCDGQNLVVTGIAAAPPYTATFQYEPLRPNGYCVQVAVTKRATTPHTEIRADGFSTPCGTIATSPRTLQRSVQLTY